MLFENAPEVERTASRFCWGLAIQTAGQLVAALTRSEDRALLRDTGQSKKGDAASTEARIRSDPFERLRTALEDTSWSQEPLAEYVAELSQSGAGEDIFLRVAFRCANFGGPSTCPQF